jgi:hypothetical protein
MQEDMIIEGNRRFRNDDRIEALRDETAHDETLATAFEREHEPRNHAISPAACLSLRTLTSSWWRTGTPQG